jgi:uncharacterized membrane protein
MKKQVVIYFLLLLPVMFAVAHGGKKHAKDSTKVPMDSTMNMGEGKEHIAGDTTHHHDEGMTPDETKVAADLEDFPTLHPLIVHFAIVLIIVTAALQLLNLILIKKEISFIIAAILFIGVLAAWMAGRNFHPHTHGISDHAKMVLEQHDKWADWTINTGIVALILHVVNLFVFKTKRWAMTIVAVVLVGSGYSVLHAGHYGAQLVHIEGIGPQGKYLEMKHHH